MIADQKDLDNERQQTMYHPSEIELSETTKMILEAVERGNPSRIVFDSLSELRLLAQNSLRYRRQILALKQFHSAASVPCCCWMTAASEGSDLQLQSIAHGVITLERLAPAFAHSRRRLRVIKFRGTDFRGGYHDFTISRRHRVFPRLVALEH